MMLRSWNIYVKTTITTASLLRKSRHEFKNDAHTADLNHPTAILYHLTKAKMVYFISLKK